jgi:signal transduction histidine kinase/ligand-binding sensor domain-containing protein
MERASQRRIIIAPGILLACVLLALCPSAFGLNPALDVNQYAHTSWKIRDGFSKGSISSIAQTPDGYLWLGTQFGLLRFDGVKNVPWRPPLDQQLPSDTIMGLLVARDGTLWIGTLKGLASWKDGKLTQYTELSGQYIYKLLEDHEGTVWAAGGAATTGRLCAIRNGNVQCYGEDGSLGRAVFSLYEDSKGNLWVGVKEGLWRWKPGAPKFYSLPGEWNGIRGLGEDTDSTLLVGWNGGIQRFVDGKTEAYPLAGITGQLIAKRILRDRDGGLWIGTQESGLVHVHQGRKESFAASDSLSGDDIYTLFEDREGDIWVATINGLDRFRDFTVATISGNQGLSNAHIGSVLVTTDGSVWLGTYGGLNRWNNGQITSYRERAERTTTGVREIIGSGLPDKGVESLFQDSRQRIWIATVGGIGYLENDRFISISMLPGKDTLSIAEDTEGNLWIANEQGGLLHLIRGSEIQQIPWSKLGHKDHASALAADPWQGGLWLGFDLGGVTYFIDGQVRASYTATDGLGQGRVNHLRLDQEGTLWAATEGGLSRLKNGRVSTLTVRNNLPCDSVHWSIEDNAKSIWLYTACGIVRIARSEWDAWAIAVDQGKDTKPMIHVTVFDSSDGVRTLAGVSHYGPQVTKSSDGRLWFTGVDGVSVVDPSHLSFNKLPPPVHVEQIIADRKTYDASGQVRLPPLIRDLEIDYTALSLVAPEKVLFRYKLEGYDSDWQEAGNRRQAFYTNLPPRNYRFRVMACNNSGVWNEVGTYFDFTIAPAYYQTTWFRVAGIIVFLLVLGGIYHLRLKQVARQVRGRMEERLEERERIARDLHDTLLQSVQGLILKFHAVAKQIPSDEPAHDALEKTLDDADGVLAEGRDRLRNLRATSIPFGGLPAAFERVAEETPQGADATFKTVVEGRVRELHPMVREECYWIGREAVVNALTHSHGRKVEVEITYDPRQFRLRVRDDGRGIDPKILEEGGRSDHWGMQGMRERAQKIGGQLNVWSRPETGTEVELIIPRASAYQTAHDKSKKFWLRSSSGNNDEAPRK